LGEAMSMSNRDSLWMLVLMVFLALAVQLLLVWTQRRIKRIAKEQPLAQLMRTVLQWVFGTLSVVLWSLAAIGILQSIPGTRGIAGRIVALGGLVFREVRDVIFTPFKMGTTEISVFTLFQVVVFIGAILLLAAMARRVLLKQILSKTPLDLGIQHAVATFTQYFVLVIGFMVGLPTVGIDLSALTFIAGAVGVGVGFGLQNVTNNFISGIIILFERPIKIGDRIEVGDVNGDVVHIAARSTTVRTNDNIAIIIPNSSFISSNVINWSHGDSKVRFRVPVGVAYSSDVRRVEKLLLEVAKENENVLEDPPSRVVFKEFGESALKFELRVWSSRLLHRRGVLISQLNFAIFEKFKEHGIQIPYPQRDLHFKQDPVTSRTLKSLETSPLSS
jgi:small-conductance mechanosensitive channel